MVHLMNVDDKEVPAEQDLGINADASQASAKSISQARNKIAPLIPMIANLASSAMSAGSGGGEQGAKGLHITEPIVGIGTKTGKKYLMGEDGNETLIPDSKLGKSHNSNCPYCNNSGKNKEHDKNPDKFHAWMDSERQKSTLINTRFMNKIESADPSTVQHQPKVRKPWKENTGKPPFRTPSSEIDEVRASDTHRAMPKGQEKIPFKVLRGSKTKKPYLINAKDRDDIDPDLEKSTPIKTPDKTDAPAKDRITPRLSGGFIQDLPIKPEVPKPTPETPLTGDAPNLKPSRGKLGFLKDKNPFKGSNQKPQEDGYMITDAGNLGVKVGGTNPNAMSKVPHGVAAQDISNKSFYSLRTKDGYGSGDLSLQNVIPNTVVNDKETYIGQTASGKHRMIDRNKITNTRIGDDIHYYVNGVEDRGIVVKMGNEYIQIFKEDGFFHDVHINDTFFVKDIVVNKTWDAMDANERYDALTEIHAPSPRFIGKSWNELPVEIKDLLTKKGAGSKIPAEAGRMGSASAELPPVTTETSKPDENTKYFSAYGGKLLGTGTKGKLAQQNEKEPNVNELKSEDFRKLKPTYQGDAEEKEKSDVEEGTYGNIGSTSNVAPSTSTNLDVSESTGYEERPHISVEEVGSLPRRDAKDNDADETKEKEDDIKEPKESKDTKKVGVPTGNYNTFGLTYSVKANTVWNKKTQRWEQKDEE